MRIYGWQPSVEWLPTFHNLLIPYREFAKTNNRLRFVNNKAKIGIHRFKGERKKLPLKANIKGHYKRIFIVLNNLR
jgi:hypothetical protein